MVFATSKFFANTKLFSQKWFCGSFGISLFVSRDTYKSKVAYSWIFPNPTYAGIHCLFVVPTNKQTNKHCVQWTLAYFSELFCVFSVQNVNVCEQNFFSS